MNKNRGITLIALVITVIVMLILAAVAMSAITNPEGIFSQARKAGENYNQASKNEADEISELIDKYLEDYYFDAKLDVSATKTLPITVNITVKNNDGTNFNDKDLKYGLSISEGYTISVADGVNERTLAGGQNSEETFAVTIDIIDDNASPIINLFFNIKEPYASTVNKNIVYQEKIYSFNYTGAVQTFTVPATGAYKIECWGASGGRNFLGSGYVLNEGEGGYTTGMITLEKGTNLYVYVGEQGEDGKEKEITNASFNGGGYGNIAVDGGDGGGAGGGATDIRLINDSWDNFAGLKSRIMVAGGGGGGPAVDLNYTLNGSGCGGGLEGSGVQRIWQNQVCTGNYNATQTTGYAFGVGANGINSQIARWGRCWWWILWRKSFV